MIKTPSNFLANVVKLTAGSGFAQAIGVIATPIITRLFAPEAFGTAALFISISSIIVVVICLRYELAIMLPDSDEDAANLLIVCLIFIVIITAVVAIIAYFASRPILSLLNEPNFEKYTLVIPIMVFFSGIFLALNYWNSRLKRFGRLSIARVNLSMITQVFKIIFGFLDYIGAGTLIAAHILGQIFISCVLSIQTWKNDNHLFKKSIRFNKVINCLKRYRKFPAFSTLSALLSATSRNLPVIILAFFFLPSVVGFFALGRTVLNIPINLLGGAVSQVFYQRASELKKNNKDLAELVVKIFNGLVFISIFPLLLIAITGKDLFSVAFGANWAEAGVYAQLMCMWIFFHFISVPLSFIFGIFERQGSYLIFDIIAFMVRIIFLVFGCITGNILIAIASLSFANTLCFCFLTYWILRSAGVHLRLVMYYIVKISTYCMPLLGIIVLAKWLLQLDSLVIVIIGAFSLLLFYIIPMKYDKDFKRYFVIIK